MGRKLIIEIPEDIFISLGKTSKELIKEIKLITAVKFFEEGKLSIGEAAKFTGVSKWTFVEELEKKGESVFNYPPEELERDLEDIEKTLSKNSDFKK